MCPICYIIFDLGFCFLLTFFPEFLLLQKLPSPIELPSLGFSGRTICPGKLPSSNDFVTHHVVLCGICLFVRFDCGINHFIMIVVRHIIVSVGRVICAIFDPDHKCTSAMLAQSIGKIVLDYPIVLHINYFMCWTIIDQVIDDE